MEGIDKEPLFVRFLKAKTLRFFVAEIPEEYSLSDAFLDKLAVKLSGQNSINPDKKTFTTTIGVMFVVSSENTQQEQVFIDHKAKFDFQISNFNEIFIEEEQRYISNGKVTEFIVGTSLSTLRGMLIERLSNTNFSHIILPFIDPTSINRNVDIENAK